MSHWPCHAVPRCRAARIDSISILTAGRDVARGDWAMRHITVNLGLLVDSCMLFCKCVGDDCFSP